jgi:hypothetical protein
MYDIKDSRGVPVSGGIPPVVTIAATIGLIMILAVLGIVIGASRSGHVWPAADTTKIPLDTYVGR